MRIKRVKTVPRGYRLKPETHKLIAKIQKLMNANADEVINAACGIHYEKIKEMKQQNPQQKLTNKRTKHIN